MDPSRTDSTELVKNSALYKEFLAEREEILRHKWIESEKAGYDIGFERALFDWKYRSTWCEKRLAEFDYTIFPRMAIRHSGRRPEELYPKGDSASVVRRSGVMPVSQGR